MIRKSSCLEEAFDSVNQKTVIEILAKRGHPRQMIIACLYHGNTTKLEDGSVLILKKGYYEVIKLYYYT